MKKIIFFLLIWFALSKCSAQTRLIPGEIKGKHDTFIIQKYPKPFDTINNIVISSKKNKYNNGIPYTAAEKSGKFVPMHLKTDIQVDNGAIKQIVFAVLGEKLNSLKNNKEVMSYILYFKHDGQISDISFGLHKNTLITLQEIEEIDRRLRTTVKATFTGKAYLQYEVVNYNIAPQITF
jgi:hypothetical protein